MLFTIEAQGVTMTACKDIFGIHVGYLGFGNVQ